VRGEWQGARGIQARKRRRAMGKREEALKAAERCAEYLKARYGVKRVIPFGSVVGDGPWHEGSDLDLAVEGLAAEHFYRALAELERMVPPWLPVDLVPLEEVSERVRKHILGEEKMPEDRYLALKIRIEGEIENIEKVVEGARSYLAQAPSVVPEIEMRGLATYVEDFYSGCERIFERVAVYLDGGVPKGESWHKELLEQMVGRGPLGARPPVLSQEIAERLDDYRSFRHRRRHRYGFELEWKKVRDLAEGMVDLWEGVKRELRRFGEWLEGKDRGEP